MHYPIKGAASHCGKLCQLEHDIFAAVLGENVEVERLEHITARQRRCVYSIRLRWSVDNKSLEP
ncbi:hypothetical protein ACDQ55_14245 [Chitinophaga sp. 30R24]|uniref:hypothetical protein n=1 Tax=Chitinophaga sp. 30R24 TaxID=3248838 RepID=UPI003B91B87F